MVAFRLLVASSILCACRGLPPDPDRRLDVQVQGETFATRGYRFAVLPEAGAKVVQLDIQYPIGSAHDPIGKAGLAHLTEHLLFEVEYATGDTKTSIGAELKRLALGSNAWTAVDYTNYSTLVAASSLDAVFALEMRRLEVGCGGLTEAIFIREREVVLNELRQRGEDDLGAAIRAVVFPEGHPYRASDTVDSVSRLALKDVCDLLAGTYRRGEVIIALSGDIDMATAQALATRHVERAIPRTPVAPAIASVAPLQNRLTRIRADVEKPLLIATWPIPARTTREYRILDLTTETLGIAIGNRGSRWESNGYAHAEVLGGRHAPVLALMIGLSSPDKLDDAIDGVERSLRAITTMDGGLGRVRTHEPWVEIRERRAESLIATWESLRGRNALMSSYLSAPRNGYLLGEIKELAELGPDEPRALVKRYLSPERARYILVEPSNPTGVSRPRTYFGGGAEAHDIRVDGALADQPVASPALTPPKLIRYELANGLKVVLWPHGTLPLVHGRLVVDSGTGHEPANRAGLSTMIGGGWRETADSLLWSQRTLAGSVDRLIADLAAALATRGYQVGAESRVRLAKLIAKQGMAIPFEEAALTALYGANHPYTRGTITEKSLPAIDTSSVTSWAREHIVPRNATLILSGKFDPTLVRKHIAYAFGDVAGGRDSPDVDMQPITVPRPVAGVEPKPTPIVLLRLHAIGGRGLDAEHGRRLVLAEVLNRQLERLRGKHALTYGFGANYISRKSGGLWTIGGFADKTRAAEGATELMAVLTDLRQNPESYRTAFIMARQRVLESLVLGSFGAEAIADRLVESERFDLPANFYDSLARSVAQLTLADFHPFVVSELAPERLVFGAFGNVDAVTAAIAASKALRN